jgi:hypothetical protein
MPTFKNGETQPFNRFLSLEATGPLFSRLLKKGAISTVEPVRTLGSKFFTRNTRAGGTGCRSDFSRIALLPVLQSTIRAREAELLHAIPEGVGVEA